MHTAVMELPPETLTWLKRKAYILVQSVMRHMYMDASERHIFREDMTQEALSHLYDLYFLQGQTEAYAYTAARTRLIGYVFVNIRGGGSGHQWELSKQYEISDNLTEPEYHEEDSYGQKAPRLPMSIYARRPTEDALVLHEGTAACEARWERFEKEIARILAVMRGQQWHPNSLRRVNGKVQNRSVQLGEVGHITRQRLWDKSLELQAKLAELEAAAEAAQSAAPSDGPAYHQLADQVTAAALA